MFVRTIYKSTFLKRSHRTSHTSPPSSAGGRRDVWTHNIPPFLPFRSLFSRAGAAFCADDGCRRQVLPLNRYIRDSGTCAFDVTGVTFAELLQRLSNPHSHMPVCVASKSVYMRTSGSFSTCFVVSAHSRVCVFVCLYPRVVT